MSRGDKQTENICRFVTGGQAPDVLQTLNFVYETTNLGNDVPKMAATARIHLVTAGTATVRCGGSTRQVKKGDLFFLLPAVSYTITGSDDFCYLYISFIGLRSGILLDRLHIGGSNFVFPDFSELEPFWWQAIALPPGLMDLASESVLLYTLAQIGRRLNQESDAGTTAGVERMLLVKKYIDDNFSDPSLSLKRLSEVFSYNAKYLSAAFARQMHVGINEYLNTVRIHYACRLIAEKYTGVADIAALCGFADAMYFSKVFKRYTGHSPRSYIAQQSENGS